MSLLWPIGPVLFLGKDREIHRIQYNELKRFFSEGQGRRQRKIKVKKSTKSVTPPRPNNTNF